MTDSDLARQIAERLHRDLCQILAATSLEAALLKKDLAPHGAAGLAQAEKVCHALRQASAAARQLMQELQAIAKH